MDSIYSIKTLFSPCAGSTPTHSQNTLTKKSMLIQTMQVVGLIVTLAVVTTLSGCSAFNYVAPDSPRSAQLTTPINQDKPQNKPRIAVVLGSGGPRGYAHIGVIRALEDAGIVPDLIVGSSVGALIGSFWASGLSGEQIERKSAEGGPLTLFDLNPFADRGWIRGQRLQDYVNTQLGEVPLESFARQMIVTATRRVDKQPVNFVSGNTGVAVRASSAVVGIISPVGIDGIEYEDGDESMPVPVSVARAAGAQLIIAVDVSAWAGSAPEGTNRAWLDRDAARRARIDPEVAKADFLIHPDLGYVASPRRSYFEMAQKQGRATATAQMPQLLRLIQSRFPDWKPVNVKRDP